MFARAFKVLITLAAVADAVQVKMLAEKTSTGDSIGRAKGFIDGSKKTCLDDECAYGILLTEALRGYGRRQGKDTQIALYNGGGIRASIEEGAVTREDIEKVHPFGNNVWFVKLEGSTIRKALRSTLSEHGAPNTGDAGSWLQVAGLRFKALWQNNAWTLSDIAVNTEGESWEVLWDEKMYNVVTNTYIIEGNNGRNIIKDGAVGKPEKDDMTIANLMINYFTNNSPVEAPELDGRETLIIAETTGEIEGNKEACYDRSCSYGILLTKAMLQHGRNNGHGTQIALYNGGGIRASIPEGEITAADLRRVHPFGNNIEFLELKGSTIKEALMMSLKEHGPPAKGASGSWFQMSGLEFKAAWNGSAWDMKNITVKSEKPNAPGTWMYDGATYKVATNTYILQGNGGRNIIKNGAMGAVTGDITIAALMIAYFAENSPVSPPVVDNRVLLACGMAADTIDGEKETCRDHSCEYGIMMCEALKAYGKKEGKQTEVCLYNAGAIRASVPPGDVTENEIFKVHPFGNEVWFAQLPGSVLREYIEMALEEHKGPGQGTSGSWMQVAGMRLKAVWGGSSWTLQYVEIDDDENGYQELEENKLYRLVTNTYIMEGNGERNIIKDGVTSFMRDDKLVAELMIDYFASHSPVSPPEVDDRVILE